MSWAEVKKINSDLNTPLDELINSQVGYMNLMNGGDFEVFTSSRTFVVPNGVYALYVSGVGSGASGGSGSMSAGSTAGNGGGSGSAGTCCLDMKINVTPGMEFSIEVGEPGTKVTGTASRDGNDGGSVKILKDDEVILEIPGGKKGHGGVSTTPGSGGDSPGDVVMNNNYCDANWKNSGYSAGNSGSSPRSGSGGRGGDAAKATIPRGIDKANIFNESFGVGGAGGQGYSQYTPSVNSDDGIKGILCICWGSFKYNDVAVIKNWYILKGIE